MFFQIILLLFTLTRVLANENIELRNYDWNVDLYAKQDGSKFASLKPIQLSPDSGEISTSLENYHLEYLMDLDKEYFNNNEFQVELKVASEGRNYTLGFNTLKCSVACNIEFLFKINEDGFPQSYVFREQISELSEDIPENRIPLIKIVQGLGMITKFQAGPKPYLFLEYEDEFQIAKKQEESSSFLLKYWYIIIPLFLIISTFSGNIDDESSDKKE